VESARTPEKAESQGAPRIVVVAPVRLYCEGIALGLTMRGCAVVGTAYDDASALRTVREIAPDVVLCDLAPRTGLPSVPPFLRSEGAPKLIALVSDLDVAAAIVLASARIAGVLAREASLLDLEQAVLGVRRGEFPCSPSVVPVLAATLQYFANEWGAEALERAVGAATGRQAVSLTRREADVVRLIRLGLSNKEIAQTLSIAVSTVKNHVHRILEKTGAEGRAQATRLLLA